MVHEPHGRFETRVGNSSSEERHIQFLDTLEQPTPCRAKLQQNLFQWPSIVVRGIGPAILQVGHGKLRATRDVILDAGQPQRLKVWGDLLKCHKNFGHSLRLHFNVFASPSKGWGLGKGTAFESPSPE